MAIALAALGTAASVTTAATTINVPYPAGIAANNWLCFYVGASATPINLPSGWTSMTGAAGSVTTTGGATLLLAGKLATGSETGNLAVTMTSGTAYGRMFRYTGVDTTTPQDVTAVNVAANASTIVVTAVTIVTAGAVDIVCATAATAGAMSAPAPMVEEDDSAGTGRSAGFYDSTRAAAGTTGTITVTLPNSRCVAIHAALRPAAGGSPPAAVAYRRVGKWR